jgi:hypothetical protein
MVSTLISEARGFEKLTPQQKQALVVYASTRDTFASVLAGYDLKNLTGARQFQYDLFSRPTILRVLISYFGPNDRRVNKMIARARRSKRITFEQFQKLKSQERKSS